MLFGCERHLAIAYHERSPAMPKTRSAEPAVWSGSAGLIRRCSLPSWVHRAPQRSHHALGQGLTTMTIWNDLQVGHRDTTDLPS
jgi:hypothetical protein